MQLHENFKVPTFHIRKLVLELLARTSHNFLVFFIMVCIYVVNDKDNDASKRFLELVNSTTTTTKGRIGIDCEGIDLGRNGTLELVSICFEKTPDQVFLVDFQNASGSPRVLATKKLLECDSVVKIIHDCRMDCDALHHLFGIDMVNVHDTSCFHELIALRDNVGLNDVFQWNDIKTNIVRDNNVYRNNHTFWSTRPLSQTMTSWAAGDVESLLQLATKQDAALYDSKRRQEAISLSTKNTTTMVDKKITTLRCRIPIGRFFGARGANIRALRKRTDTGIYGRSGSDSGVFFVYYDSEASLNQVKARMGYWTLPTVTSEIYIIY